MRILKIILGFNHLSLVKLFRFIEDPIMVSYFGSISIGLDKEKT